VRRRLSRVIAHRGEMLYGRYTVIEEARIRVRNLQNI
jgi:hypothetical protein